MNKVSEKYNTKVEIPISVILETIFSDDNHDVETLSRWAKHYGFVDLIEKDGHKYYKLQDDYTKQSFYIWLSKEERKQYEYEDYLIEKLEKLQQENKQLKDLIDTILTFSFFKEECPLNFAFEDNSKEEEAQNIFYSDEYCENNCNSIYKECWLKYFKELQGIDSDE